jgi:hypothetical protein
MSASLFISIVIVLGAMALLASTTSPSKKARRQQRLLEDQMASEKPFQMGSDPVTIKHNKHFF